jgi:hypothetical protein
MLGSYWVHCRCAATGLSAPIPRLRFPKPPGFPLLSLARFGFLQPLFQHPGFGLLNRRIRAVFPKLKFWENSFRCRIRHCLRFGAVILFFIILGACELDPPAPVVPGVPKGLTAYADYDETAETMSAELYWEAVSGASGYIVYRSSSLSGPYEEIGNTGNMRSPVFTDTDLATPVSSFYYQVKARSAAGSSGLSSPARCVIPDPGDGDTWFWAADLRTETRFYKTWAKKVAEGANCVVYAELAGYTDHSPTITVDMAEEIADEFDQEIYQGITGAFGSPNNINKITLLLLDIQDGYTGYPSSPYTAGFFHPIDMEATNSYSNKRPMLYIDTWPAKIADSAAGDEKEKSYSTIAHELQHLINYSLHPGTYAKPAMDIWINEGLSTAAEYIYSKEQQLDRIDYFSQDPSQTIRRGNNFFVWEDDWGDILAEYATVYLFFQWLGIQSGEDSVDTEIYRDIINSGFADYRAVTAAAANRISPNSPDFSDWETLLRTWYAANLICSSSGLYGYKSEIPKSTGNIFSSGSLKTRTLPSSSGRNHRWPLAPGEGVYSRLAAELTPPEGSPYGGNIQYAGIDAANGTVSVEEPYSPPAGSENYYLLTLNVNVKTEITGNSDYEPGYVTDIKPTEERDSSGRALLPSGEGYVPPQPYEWDGARYFFERFRDRPSVPARPLRALE